MRFTTSLLVVAGTAANAASLKSETQVEAQAQDYFIQEQHYPEGYNYYSHPGYQSPDYSQPTPSGEHLPGADFNRQVYEFDCDHEIWDQNDYEERVKVEAEILVALEALKSSFSVIDYDIHHLLEHIAS